MLYVRDKVNDLYSHAILDRYPRMHQSLLEPYHKNGSSSDKYEIIILFVNLPNVRKPVPLFIIRALGVLSDKVLLSIALIWKNIAVM